MPRLLFTALLLALVTLAACSGGDDMATIAADACDDMVAAAEANDPEALMAANQDAMERVEAITDDPEQAQMELLSEFEDSCPELQDALLEGIGG